MSGAYDDIIHMKYPLESSDHVKHPRMMVEDRAKIFAPFAALKGHAEAIAAKQKIVVPRMELSEESREELDRKLMMIEQMLDNKEHPMIKIVYFRKDKMITDEEEGGEYIQLMGMAAKFNPTSRLIQIVEKKIKLDDIYEIELIG